MASAEEEIARTFHKRELPKPSIDFASDRGKQLFREALAAGHMNGFFVLIQQFTTQAEPAYCGITSLVQVLNTLKLDPRRIWKGRWRWFAEDMLDCCKKLDEIKKEGITIDQCACLASCNGANVTLHRGGGVSLEDFRRDISECTRSGESHIIVSYSRKQFNQSGDGHFSPIGGYHPEDDAVLILDTARFKYPPHWVSLPELYDAMLLVDTATDRPRGYLRLYPQKQTAVLFKLTIQGSWRNAYNFAVHCFSDVVAVALAAVPEASESSGAESGAANPASSAERQQLCLSAVVRACLNTAPLAAAACLVQELELEELCNTRAMASARRQMLVELKHLPLYAQILEAASDLQLPSLMQGSTTESELPPPVPCTSSKPNDAQGSEPPLSEGQDADPNGKHKLQGGCEAPFPYSPSCKVGVTVEHVLAIYMLLCAEHSDATDARNLGCVDLFHGARKSSLVASEVRVLQEQLLKLPVIVGSDTSPQASPASGLQCKFKCSTCPKA